MVGGSKKVTVVMVLVEFLQVASITVSKAAMVRGMSSFIFNLYSNIFAALFLLPCLFLYYRKRSRLPLTFSIICRIFMLAIISSSAQILMFLGIKYSSPTLSSTMNNLVPAFTFLLAILTRMERLDLTISSSRAKAIGTLVSISGALIVTLYNGSPITIFSSSSSSSSSLINNSLHQQLRIHLSTWVIGGILITHACFLLSLLFVVQLVVSTICCMSVTIQLAIFCLVVERDPSAWTLRLDVELISILYAAIFSVAVRGVVHTWACRKEGPVFTAMFKPLGLVIAMALGVAFLGETLYLGRLFGACVISLGFYCVLWGQIKEHQSVETTAVCSSEPHQAPLLQGQKMDA